MSNWSIERRDDVLFIDVEARRGGQWLLFRSDAHSDSPHSLQEMELRHLELAKKRNAIIIDGGDVFDGMQGMHDRRRSPDDLKEEFKSENYYDELVKDAVERLAPYGKHFALLAKGNHETAIRRHAGTDLTDRLGAELQHRGSKVQVGGYRNWIVLRLTFGTAEHWLKIYHHHGSGGPAPVTKGVIQTNRRGVWVANADFVLAGHTHHGWSFPLAKTVMDGYTIRKVVQWHLQCPGYKDGSTARDMGWEVEREFSPQPNGAWFIRFFLDEEGALRNEIIFTD